MNEAAVISRRYGTALKREAFGKATKLAEPTIDLYVPLRIESEGFENAQEWTKRACSYSRVITADVRPENVPKLIDWYRNNKWTAIWTGPQASLSGDGRHLVVRAPGESHLDPREARDRWIDSQYGKREEE